MKHNSILVFFFLIYTISSILYSKILHATDPKARCLDGSIPGVYLHEGSLPRNILFYLMGGGSCIQGNLQDSLKSCYRRSLTDLGSSNYWPAEFNSSGLGILDTQDTSNKFSNWTKIILTYCDGTLFQGNNAQPVLYNGSKLYFRGAVNMRSHIKWANDRFDLNNANKIVLAGSSAGGMAVYLWIDYLRGLVKNPNKVYGIADSSIFMDPESLVAFSSKVYSMMPISSNPATTIDTAIVINNSSGTINLSIEPAQSSTPATTSASPASSINPSNNKQLGSAPTLPSDSISQFMAMTNANQRPPNTKCLNSLKSKEEDWKCLFAGYASKFLQAKLLWIYSQYDSYIINNILQANCLLNQSSGSGFTIKKCSIFQTMLFDLYKNTVITQIFSELLESGHSVWSIACSWHVSIADSTIYYSKNQKAPNTGNRLTIKEAVQEFVFSNKVVIKIDEKPWPSNKQCAF